MKKIHSNQCQLHFCLISQKLIWSPTHTGAETGNQNIGIALWISLVLITAGNDFTQLICIFCDWLAFRGEEIQGMCQRASGLRLQLIIMD